MKTCTASRTNYSSMLTVVQCKQCMNNLKACTMDFYILRLFKSGCVKLGGKWSLSRNPQKLGRTRAHGANGCEEQNAVDISKNIYRS